MLDDGDIGNIAAIGPVGDPPHSKYERLIARAKQVPAATTIVVHPCEETALRGPSKRRKPGSSFPFSSDRPRRLRPSLASIVSISTALRSSTCPTATPRRQRRSS